MVAIISYQLLLQNKQEEESEHKDVQEKTKVPAVIELDSDEEEDDLFEGRFMY